MEQYVDILSVGTGLSIFVNTPRMYIMYVLNAPICINELVFPSVYSLFAYRWI